MSHAKRTDSNHSEIREGLRQVGHMVVDMSHVGHGVPDLIVLTRLHKLRLWLEVKMPGEKLTDAEAALFPHLPGDSVRIVRSLQEALDICEDKDWEADE